MTSGRNSSGKFTKGHPGFKPKGAISRKKQKRDQLLEKMFAILENDMEDTVKALKPNQRIKFFTELAKLSAPKLKRIPYEPKPMATDELDENNETEATPQNNNKIIFEFVDPTDPEPHNPKQA
jgi:hypothetical protein